MRTFIVEYTKRDEQSNNKVNLELHINLWNFKALETIFDFGFMINNIDEVKSIILYVPFKIKKLEDLGNNIIEKNQILVDAIFNERCETIKFYPKRLKVIKKGNYDTREEKKKEKQGFLLLSNNRLKKVKFKFKEKEKEVFILYSLSENQINLRNYDKYARIEINVENILSNEEKENHLELEDKKYYFRIRFFPEDNNITMIKRENEKINIFQDASLRTTEIIDFRINDLRSCPENLREEFLRTPRFMIKKIHYLIMRNSTDEFITVGEDEVNGRLLEKEIWKEYIEIKETDMIAYHIKGGKDSSFSNLSRFKYPLNIRKRILCYIMIGLILSLFSSFIYDMIVKMIVKWRKL